MTQHTILLVQLSLYISVKSKEISQLSFDSLGDNSPFPSLLMEKFPAGLRFQLCAAASHSLQRVNTRCGAEIGV
jgi:hypothetical protein